MHDNYDIEICLLHSQEIWQNRTKTNQIKKQTFNTTVIQITQIKKDRNDYTKQTWMKHTSSIVREAEEDDDENVGQVKKRQEAKGWWSTKNVGTW